MWWSGAMLFNWNLILRSEGKANVSQMPKPNVGACCIRPVGIHIYIIHLQKSRRDDILLTLCFSAGLMQATAQSPANMPASTNTKTQCRDVVCRVYLVKTRNGAPRLKAVQSIAWGNALRMERTKQCCPERAQRIVRWN